MNEKQYKEFAYVVKQCEDGQYRSINVASKIRSDAIIAASTELNELRAKLRLAEDGLSKGSTRPHSGPMDCPTWYDTCNCNADALVWNIERAEKAEDALRKLVKFSDEKTNTSTILFMGALAYAREVLDEKTEKE